MANDEPETDDQVAVSDKVEILSTDDNKIKAIGEILSSDSSREIFRLLFNDSLTANQIAQKTGISLPLVIYHLKKMQDTGVVRITNVGKNTKSHDVKFYTADKFAIVILPQQMSAPAKKSKSLFNSFNRIHRLATLGGALVAAWFSSQFLQQGLGPMPAGQDESEPVAAQISQKSEDLAESADVAERTAAPTPAPDVPPGVGGDVMTYSAPTSEPSLDLFWSIITVLSVAVIGLIIELAIRHKESKIIKR